ncbi:MAG: hypothetical protein KF824_06360 [Fimbriimonadaceae bacterium]|nr:MAG: hypothetical protein KF824_06360 [Fimbriimonadaceae bacterium]
MACRIISIPGTRQDLKPDEEQAYQKLLGIARELASQGIKAEPNNCFWALQLAVFSSDSENAARYLEQASKCTYYSDYAWEENTLIQKASPYQLSSYEQVQGAAVILFPHLTYYRTTCSAYIGNGSLENTIRQRLIVIQIGKIMSTTANVYIPVLVGKSLIVSALNKQDAESSAKQKYSLDALEAACAHAGIDSSGAFKAAVDMQREIKEVNFPRFEGWSIIERFGPGLIVLPFLAAILLLTVPLLILGTQKVADRPWLRPVRYLAVLPLSLCFINSSTSQSFHTGIIAIIFLVSLPLAYFAFTERFIPVIHLTTVAIAFQSNYRGENFDSFVFETGCIAVMTLAAWAKNRAPEKRLSKVLSYILLLSASAAIVFGIATNLGSSRLFDGVHLILILLAFIGITDSDKMTARRQANLFAALGLAFLAASSIFSLQVSEKIRRTLPEEQAFIRSQQQMNERYFSSAINATNPHESDVKPSK